MRCKITASAFYPKFAKINFVHPRDDCFPGFVREAIAFPCHFDEGNKVTIPEKVFKLVLSAGAFVDIGWSKKMNCFVVRFCNDDFAALM